MAYSECDAEFDRCRYGEAGITIRTAATATRDQLDRELADARRRAAPGPIGSRRRRMTHVTTRHRIGRTIRRKWQAHVAEARARVDRAVDQMDTDGVVAEADLAEAYASDAIDFALDAIDEAQYAALDAYSARAKRSPLARDPAGSVLTIV